MQLSEILYSIGQWSGLFAFASLAFLIFSGDTARFTDRYFGLDRIIKFQRKFSFLVGAFVFLHPILFVLSGQSFFNYFVPMFYVIPLSLGTLAFYIFIAVMLFSYFYKRISYKAWQYIHVLTYILVFMSLYHAIFWGSHAGNPIFIAVYAVFSIAIVAGIIYRTNYKIKEKKFGRAKVGKIKWENDNIFTVSVLFEKPISFQAGQFYFLRLNKDKLYARHPFTASSAPSDGELLFSIKNTGRFTDAVSRLKPGEEIMVDGPFGRFAKRDKTRDALFIAGGIGITPFRSLIRDCLQRGQIGKISLVYCAKKEKDLVFRHEFDSVVGEKFRATYILSDEDIDRPGCCRGHISQDIIKDAISGMEKPCVYICGPEGLKNGSISMLKNIGISADDIITEDFFW